MGNLLIVDDEPDILVSLEELFRYESGLDVSVYTAKSAVAAVQLLEQHKFEVVMTDVKMPRMSGIELYRVIKENWPKCRVIFLTGFRDFDDLYEISSYKDARYLQKSEDDETLVEAVAAAFREIEDMMVEEREENSYQKEIRRAEFVLRKNTMREFFWNTGRVGLTQEKLNQIKLPIDLDKNLFLFLIRMDQYREGGELEEEINREMGLCDIIEEFLPPRFEYYLYCDSHGYGLLFFQPVRFSEDIVSARNWKYLYKNLLGTLEYIQEKALRLSGLSVSFVTCEDRCFFKDGPACLNRFRQEALEKIPESVQVVIEARSKIQSDSVMESGMPANLQLLVKELEHMLEIRAFGEAVKRIRYLTDLLVQLQGEPVRSQELYYSISVVLTRVIHMNHIKNKIEPELSLERLMQAEMHGSMEEAGGYLVQVLVRVIEELNVRGKSRSSEVLDKVILYMDSHIAEDLTLGRLAEIGYMNPSYLSRIFKQQYGCNVTEYVTNLRIEKAKELLCTTSSKVNEIAAMVGYFSVPSFNRVFKKETGMSPAEYRSRYGEHNHEIS